MPLKKSYVTRERRGVFCTKSEKKQPNALTLEYYSILLVKNKVLGRIFFLRRAILLKENKKAGQRLTIFYRSKGMGAPHLAREFRRGSAGGSCPCGGGAPFAARRAVLSRLLRGEAPARGGALNLYSACAIAVSSLGHFMSLHCEGTPSWERGKKKIRQKSAVSAVALSWRHRAAFWGNAANILFAPSPSRVSPRAPLPLNPLPLVDFSCGRKEQAPWLIQRGRVGGALI